MTPSNDAWCAEHDCPEILCQGLAHTSEPVPVECPECHGITRPSNGWTCNNAFHDSQPQPGVYDQMITREGIGSDVTGNPDDADPLVQEPNE